MTDCNNWNIPTLMQFFEERIEEINKRSDERIASIHESMRVEREQIDKRFEAANRYKETYSETLSKLSNESLRREEVDSRLAVVQEKIDNLSRTNWPLYSSFAGVIASMIVGLWVIIGLKIEATNQPVVVSLEQTKIANESRDRSIADLRVDFQRINQGNDSEAAQKSRDISNLQQIAEASRVDRSQLNERLRIVEGATARSAQADANSTTDRAQLNDRIHQIEGNMAAGQADRKSTEASLKASLIEVETQFCGSDTVRNLMHANDLRVMSVLWKKAGLGEYPIGNAYYPQVCNRNVNQK